MNPAKVRRDQLQQLTDLPNVGPAMARDLQLLGISRPDQLVGRDPVALYTELAVLTASRQDPCVLDVFISITRFMNGADPQPWWKFTAERQRLQRRQHLFVGEKH